MRRNKSAKMLNLLYDDLPLSIYVNGREYPIYTDFREWIALQDTLLNSQDEYEIFAHIKNMFMDDCPQQFELALIELTNFMIRKEKEDITHEQKSENCMNKKEVFSYLYDAPYIIGAFLECYHINLLQIEYMHWWLFNALLESLNSKCELKQRIMYRSIDLSKVKDKQERNRIKRIQRAIALPSQELKEEAIASVFL